MRSSDIAWLALAGLGGGLTGSIAGLASLVSYPALLAVGLPPVSANVSNTVALVFNSVGSVGGSRPELVGQGVWAKRLGILAVAGGITGGLLLLALPGKSFELAVPWLIALGSVGVVLRRSPGRPAPHPTHHPTRAVAIGVFCITVYGGYFGAAAGVLMLALFLMETTEPLPRCNAMKNLLLGLANGCAAIAFAIFGPVRWEAVVPLAIGFFIGGRIGPSVVRRAPAGPLRVLIALAGLGLAVKLGIDAYT